MKSIDIFYSTNIGSRQNNEDSMAVQKTFKSSKSNLSGHIEFNCTPITVCVADGMGGEQNGKENSMCVVKSFIKHKEEEDTTRISHISRDVLKLQKRKHISGGSTLAALQITSDERDSIIAYASAVGDSLIYLIRNQNVARINTPENEYEARLAEGDPLPESENERLYLKSGLLNYFGKENVTSQQYKFFLDREDTIIICSDGAELKDTDSLNFLEYENPAEEYVKRNVERNFQTIKCSDNTTAIIIKIN